MCSFKGISTLMTYQKSLTEKAIAQISNDDLQKVLPGFDHSISILMKHISGNLVSRWTNFRTEDGEKPWRNRDQEFVDEFTSREEIMECWQKGWEVFDRAMHSISDDDIDMIIYIRNEGHTLHEAAERTLSHISYHTGQIVMLAKNFAGDQWNSLSIPKGKTDEYNRKKFQQEKSRGLYKDRLQ
jgi:hypothetical protein